MNELRKDRRGALAQRRTPDLRVRGAELRWKRGVSRCFDGLNAPNWRGLLKIVIAGQLAAIAVAAARARPERLTWAGMN
jgi:hypothetical protein